MSEFEEMLSFYEKWPSLFNPVEITFNVEGAKAVYGCGYGASLIPLYVMSSLVGHEKVNILRPGEMPNPGLAGNTLVVVSHSGDTAEAVLCMHEGLKQGMKVYAVTGGGSLESYALKYGIPIVKINKARTSRLGLPFILSGLSPLLDQILGSSSKSALASMFADIEKRAEEYGKEGAKIAEFIKGGLVAGLYYSLRSEGLALRFRYLLSENAKLHAVFENIMEVAHDGITAWEMYSGLPVVMIQEKEDPKIVKDRFKIIGDALTALGHRVYWYISDERHILQDIYTLDVASVFLSYYRKVSPFAMQTQSSVRRMIRLDLE